MTGPSRVFMDGPGEVRPDAPKAYRQLVNDLYGLSKSGTILGLDRVEHVLRLVGSPEQTFPAIHVAGSNGKGSTCAFLASILQKAGLKVGLYTSPHLVSLTERIQILEGHEQREIDPNELVDEAERLRSVAPDFSPLTFFEAMTVMAFLYFAKEKVDVAVVEAGLGARLDATRLCDANVAVLTDISLEHADILGPTLLHVAKEEAEVMRPKRPLIMADGDPAVVNYVLHRATEQEARPLLLDRDFNITGAGLNAHFRLHDGTLIDAQLSLRGQHQRRNAALALEAALSFLPSLSQDTMKHGVETARWPGRMELFVSAVDGLNLLLDGAQNAHAASVLTHTLQDQVLWPGANHLVFGALSDKDAGLMLASLLPVARSFVLTRPKSPRARNPEELRSILEGVNPASDANLIREVDVCEDPEEALHHAEQRARRTGGRVVVCGSLYLVGQIRARLLPSR